MAPRLFVFVCQTRYSWETLMVIIVSFLPELLEFSEDRHPWESVEEKLHEIRYELLVVSLDHLCAHPSFRPASLRPYPCPSLLASLPPSLSPLRFHFPLSSYLHPSILASLPSTSLRPSVATSLPSSLSLPLPFSYLCLPLDPFSLSPFLPRSFSPFLPPYPTPHSLLSFLTPQTDQWHFTRSLYISLVCFWLFFCWTIALISIPFSETWCDKWWNRWGLEENEELPVKMVPTRLFFLVEYLQHRVNNSLACLTLKQK